MPGSLGVSGRFLGDLGLILVVWGGPRARPRGANVDTSFVCGVGCFLCFLFCDL